MLFRSSHLQRPAHTSLLPSPPHPPLPLLQRAFSALPAGAIPPPTPCTHIPAPLSPAQTLPGASPLPAFSTRHRAPRVPLCAPARQKQHTSPLAFPLAAALSSLPSSSDKPTMLAPFTTSLQLCSRASHAAPPKGSGPSFRLVLKAHEAVGTAQACALSLALPQPRPRFL